jgi:DNA-directed RNA polymerase specialized sigma54-like protein
LCVPQIGANDVRDQIAAQLEKRDGIKIARRTVTKYRKALAIPSSSQRREF